MEGPQAETQLTLTRTVNSAATADAAALTYVRKDKIIDMKQPYLTPHPPDKNDAKGAAADLPVESATALKGGTQKQTTKLT
ncbi:hypothetical protein RUM44_005385 [Polyplax serrata]|uniref:Uncharacterized protein n=1 Tax=Polyplax serrata TaxID=468196 RepID=A0ABR1ADE0_POLSC